MPFGMFQSIQYFPGIWASSWKGKNFFSCDAIRPLHRAQNFHKTHECGDKITETQRSQYPGVSRRSSTLVRLGNSVSATHVIGQRRIRVEGFSRQFFQKSSKTKSDFRVLGPVMEHTIRNNLAFDSTSQIYTKNGKKCHQENHSLSKAISGNSGKNKLRDNSRPTKQVLGEKLVQISKIFQKQSEETNTSSTSEKSTQVAAESEIGRKSSSESPTSISGNIHRFIPDRMGVSLISGSSEQRSVALFVHQPAYQFEGTNLRVLRTERDQSTSQHSYKGELRQHDHSLRSEEAGLGQVLTAQQLDLCCATPCSEKEDLDFGRPHTGPFQRDGRCSIENRAHSNRMEAGSPEFPEPAENTSGNGGGRFCNSREHPAAEIHLPIPGPSFSGDQRFSRGLESLVTNISVSTNQDETNPRNSEEATDISRQSFTASAILADSGVVPAASDNVSASRPECSSAYSGSPGANNNVQFFSGSRPSGLEILRNHFETRYGHEVANIMINDARQSTLRQYNSVFRCFARFIKDTGELNVTEKTFLNFFLYCHQTLNRRTTTIYSYRSALKRLAVNIFNVDLYSDHFESFLKALRLKEPNNPAPQISWCLDKVLGTLLTITAKSDSKLFTGKIIFLLQLAMGCRISELAAVSRDPVYTKFLPGGQINLRPDPKLLERHTGSTFKKHERPDSVDGPLIIHPLFMSDGVTPSALCPVASVRDYIARFPSNDASQQLLVHHEHRKPYTIANMRTLLVSVIKKSCPQSFPKSHDIRKSAASVALMSHMNLEDISSKTGWSQPKTFWQHYNVPIKRLRSSCIALGSAAKSIQR